MRGALCERLLLLSIKIFTWDVFMLLGKSKESKFWQWFEKNEDKIFKFENNQDKVFNELSHKLKNIHKNLTFEFGPIINNQKEFVISAGGIKAAFPAVEILYNNTPKLKYFSVTKFRPRKTTIYDLSISGTLIKAESVKYLLFKDENPNKVGIFLFFSDYQDELKNLFAQIGFLFLDQILGEYDVETKVGILDFLSFDSKYFKDSKPLKELPQEFDNFFE